LKNQFDAWAFEIKQMGKKGKGAPPRKKKDRGYGMRELRIGIKPIYKKWEHLNRPASNYLKVTDRDGSICIIEKDMTLIYIQTDKKEFRAYSDARNTFSDPSRNMEERPFVGDPDCVEKIFKGKRLIK
jgi:hypothetical protein